MSETGTETDLQLLARYTRNHAEDAFAELVRRHVDLVHSAALRQVRSTQLAEEVAQSVFTDLARNSGKLKPDTILTAWLYQVTRRTAIDVVRHEARRQLREQIATEMNAMNATTADWTHIEPLLDEAMSALDETDRAAVLLRYFENKSLHEVGQAIGTSDDAAQKRVSRAVERLREFFAKRGVAVSASGLVVVISANAIQAAPIGLAVTLSATTALAGTPIVTTATATTKAIIMTTLQKALIAATLLAAVGTGIYEARRAALLANEVQTLQRQRAPLASQLQQLTHDHGSITKELAALRDENEQLRKDRAEFPRLRGELARLRNAAQAAASANATDATTDSAKSWLTRVSQLKQRLEQMPGAKIPELQYVTERDWLNAAMANLDTDEDYRRALSGLRSAVENKFVSKLQPALRKYLEANGEKFPTELAQLQPYFESPVEDAILQRYTILPAENLSHLKMGGDWIITQKTAVDEEYDSRWGIGPNGFGTSGGFKPQPVDALVPALAAFAAANNGRDPINPAQLLPYIKTPEEQAALKKLIHDSGAGGGGVTIPK